MVRLFLILALLVLQLHAVEDVQTGSLVVTYQTGSKGERLDRVRFRLTGEGVAAVLYPKGSHYAENDAKVRTVVIDSLKPGKYSVEFIVPNSDSLFEECTVHEVEITAGKVSKLDQYLRPKYGTLRVVTSPGPGSAPFQTPPTITLINQKGEVTSSSTLGRFVAKNLVPGTYTIVFEDLPGYEAPPKREVTLGPNEALGPIEGYYAKKGDPQDARNPVDSIVQKTVLVPEGKLILGDPYDDAPQNTLPEKLIKISAFQVGTYEVTNSQYAQWLNRAIKEGSIQLSAGVIHDSNKRPLFKTQEADPASQITVLGTGSDILFLPVAGKHNHPVILVTWFGAQAYCAGNQFRLPTEAEWEKAAGMPVAEPGVPLHKYRFGFRQDRIDPSWANYRHEDHPEHDFQVKTTRVGFYNGTNTFSDGSPTQNARSPVGAYDMSGNVWEWVGDWYDSNYYANMPTEDPEGPSKGNLKVAKGGCYDSLADGVRVAERIGLPPYHSDPYTGFRVAADK